MEINENNYHLGNKAMASVLLLYYHLLQEGGFTNDQAVYLDSDDFDGFSFIDTKIIENGCSLGLDEPLINEGAVIYLLSELNDMIGEYDEDYLKQDFTKKIINTLLNRKTHFVPEANDVVALRAKGEDTLSYDAYSTLLKTIYEKYVLSKFKGFVS